MVPVPIRVTSGTAEVVASGSVFTFQHQPVTFALADLKITLRFTTDSAQPGHRISSTVPAPKTLDLELTNFDNPLGIGSNSPISIGTLGNRRLYLHFRVQSFDSTSDKTVIYCFYVNEEVAR